VSDASSVDRL